MNEPSLEQASRPPKLLIGLPDGAPRVKFTNMGVLEKEVAKQATVCLHDPSASAFLVVLDVPCTINHHLNNSEKVEKKHTALDLGANTLVVETMVSREHERIVYLFQICLQKKVEQMGMSLDTIGSATVEQGNYKKEPDSSWIPKSQSASHPRIWPTLVLEVGWSETMSKLAVDAQGWLEAQGSEVQIVITIKIDRTAPRLIFQKWEKGGPRRITRQSHVEGTMTEEVHVVYENGKTTVSGSMHLQFEKVFDRPPSTNNPQEGDIAFSQQDFLGIAAALWQR